MASGLGSGTSNATVSLVKLANGGSLSSMSTSSNSAANLVFNPGPFGVATLIYGGGGDTTDRLFTMNGNAAIDASAPPAGLFQYRGNRFRQSGWRLTLTLGGSGPGVSTSRRSSATMAQAPRRLHPAVRPIGS